MDSTTLESFHQLFSKILENYRRFDVEKVLKEVLQEEDDEVSCEKDKQVHLGLIQRQDRHMKKIEQALQRIEQGSFGECSCCQENISLERLQAFPTATECLGCQEEQERRDFHRLPSSILNFRHRVEFHKRSLVS